MVLVRRRLAGNFLRDKKKWRSILNVSEFFVPFFLFFYLFQPYDIPADRAGVLIFGVPVRQGKE